MLKFLYTIILIVAVIVFGYIVLSWLTGSGGGPSLSFDGPAEIPVGVPFNLEVGISNDSDQVLQDAKITLALPEGVVFLGESAEENLLTKKLGNLGIGSLTGQSFELMVVSAPDNGDRVKIIDVSVDYSPEFLGSRFKKEEQWELEVAGSAIRLEVRAPSEIASGKELQLKISYENKSRFNLKNLTMDVEYPPAFQYEKSTLEPDENNNHWELGGLRKGSENKFTVIGKLIGPENSFFEFKVMLNAEIEGESYLINQKIISTTIQAAPLALEIITNNSSEYIAGLNDALNYKINYHYLSNSSRGTDSAVIKAKLSGQMFNLDTLEIDQGGAFSGRDKTITWNLNQSGNDLPQSGSVSFVVRASNQYPIKRLGDRNFVLKVEVQMADGKYVTVAQSDTKVAGRVAVGADVYFRDADSGVINTGPFPPIVGQATEYTIHWRLTSYSTDLKDVVVRAQLPENVTFIKTVKSVASSQPDYDPDSDEVIWRINRISATKGVISKPLEAIFQIRATPPISNIGAYMPLLGRTQVSATDEFTDTSLTDSSEEVDTKLPNDNTVGASQGQVSP